MLTPSVDIIPSSIPLPSTTQEEASSDSCCSCTGISRGKTIRYLSRGFISTTMIGASVPIIYGLVIQNYTIATLSAGAGLMTSFIGFVGDYIGYRVQMREWNQEIDDLENQVGELERQRSELERQRSELIRQGEPNQGKT